MVVHRLLYIYYFSPADSTYRPPSLYSLMCAIGYLLSIVPHAGEILLEMLTIDSYWELDTVQLLKHICVSRQDLVNSIRPMPIWRPFSISCVTGSQW
jgi:Ni/Fe-hydrogenase subunit HybB-like protein